MAMYPEVQRKAQDEIERVLGRGRLPKMVDRAHLPYVNAIVKEVLRWKPITPLGLARRAVEDDVYQGYFIPAGSIIMTNVWCVRLTLFVTKPNIDLTFTVVFLTLGP